MISLPKTKRDPKKTADLCKCRPVCKSRRREWKGELQKTSAELLLERKPVRDCLRRWPTRVYPNSPCPLLARTRHVTVVERDVERPPKVVRICQAPVDDVADTPYLKLAQMLINLGAMDAVKSRCPFCRCSGCCACDARDYQPADETRVKSRRRDMRDFDARIRRDYQPMRTMYR
ncbi:uncharacterized protein LOC123871565 [Maniola jurtina]|uniref:uncharacterized protein LOC123871565 n=1 Tax=Maniola jurtina TaxID=191418 RepID=UPI001E687462|nr:uncharacterized protein LOC123871565 [Maniola jurtina]